MTPEHARRIALDAQGLLRRAAFGRGLNGTRRALESIGYVQIDTISVVSRAHHHVLWSRVPGFHPAHLDKLVERREAFEYWAHAAAYLPMQHYRFALPRMRAIKAGEVHWIRSRDRRLMADVLERIRIDGPLKAREFAAPEHKPSGWWDWKPAKRALEQLYIQGDLMVSRREGFEKVYDLPERVLPADLDTREPKPAELAEHLVTTTLAAHGYATQKSFTYLRKGSWLRKAVAEHLRERVESGAIERRTLGNGQTVFGAPAVMEARPRKPNGNLRLLSPFDNTIIQRDRTLALFDYDYQIECYVEAPKRKFGYYCLPILWEDRLVGRLDGKAHRDKGVFEIRHLHIETPIEDRERYLTALSNALTDYAAFNDCDEVRLIRTTPREWHALAKTHLNTR